MNREKTDRLMIHFGPDGQTLLPVAVQDADSGEVLIIAFTNLAAFEATRRTGYAVFWSRSRNKLWKKGATSGDRLKVEEIRINCEQNSLLYRVTPLGAGACHVKRQDGRPHTGCFYRTLTAEGTLHFREQ